VTPKAPPLTADSLREAALAYLSHRSASVVELRRVLARKVGTWAKKAARSGLDEAEIASAIARAKDDAEAIIARFRGNGLLDDVAFATSRAKRLARSGKSSRAIASDLAHRGIDAETARSAAPRSDASELAAAVVFARKKRLGAFAREDAGTDARRRWLGALARAGYSFEIAERVLRMDRESAEEVLARDDLRGW
jgi:regulatory protein